MRNFLAATLLSVAVLTTSLSGRLAETPLQSAAIEWERGNYVAALEVYAKLLESGVNDKELETIALQTGELYRTTEITTDGAEPRFSPDGQTLLFETGTGSSRVTRVLASNPNKSIAAELHGFGAAFAPDGARIAYFAAARTAEIAEAEAAFEHAPASERAQRLSIINELSAAHLRIIVRETATGRESEMAADGLRKFQLACGARSVWFSGRGPNDSATQIYEVAAGQPPLARTTGPGDKTILRMNVTGTAMLFTVR